MREITCIGVENPIHNRIAEYRRKRGMTQAQLAEKLHCSQGDVSNVEQGKRNFPIWKWLVIARELGTTVEEVYGSPENI